MCFVLEKPLPKNINDFWFGDPPQFQLGDLLSPPEKKKTWKLQIHLTLQQRLKARAKMLQNQLSNDQNPGYLLLGDEILSSCSHEISGSGALTNE